MTAPQCRGTTDHGRCLNRTLNLDGYCRFHGPPIPVRTDYPPIGFTGVREVSPSERRAMGLLVPRSPWWRRLFRR